jgi:excisionase family DNA binding protein
MDSPVPHDPNRRRRTVRLAAPISTAIPISVSATPLASTVSRGTLRTRIDRAGRPHWTIDALAARWAVSTRTVRRLIDSGQLRAIRIGGQLRVSPEVVERYEERQEVRRD